MGFIPEDFNPCVGAWWATALGRQGAVGRCVSPEIERLTGSIDGLKMDGRGGARCDQSYGTRGHREGRGFVVGCGGRGGQEGERGEDEGGRELHVEVMELFCFVGDCSLTGDENGESDGGEGGFYLLEEQEEDEELVLGML